MSMQNSEIVAVKADDAVSLAWDKAMARVNDMKSCMNYTFLDKISCSEWAKWDGTSDVAIVMDPTGVEGSDMIDMDDLEGQAA